jgi:hypothetical protein
MIIFIKKIMCPNESISIPEGLDINNKNFSSFNDPFIVKIKVIFLIFNLIQINFKFKNLI